MTPRALLTLIASGTVLAGVVTWRLQTPPPSSIEAAILLDRSRSILDPCDALPGTLERVMQRLSVQPESAVSVFVTGNADNAQEPVLLFSRLSPPAQRLVKAKKHLLDEQGRLIRRIQERCKAQAPTDSTPLFLGIQQVVAHLRSVAPATAEKELFVLSDLRETVDQHIRRALTQPVGAKFEIPTRIDNTGVSVTICGYAETRDRQNLPTERLTEVWARLFAAPGRYKPEPFCPKATFAIN